VSTWPRIEAALGRTDVDFFTALLHRDIQTLEELLANDFVIVDVASGSVHHRATFLEAVSGGIVTFREIKNFPGEAMIRRVGPGTGIVIGRTAMSFTGPGGARTAIASRYTHVFQASGRNWRLVSPQGTPIPGSH
jgi:ketosteroid isomerase-like protein